MASFSSFSSFPTVRTVSRHRRRKPLLAAGFAGFTLPTIRCRKLNKKNNNYQPFSFVVFSSSQDESKPSEEEEIDTENNDDPLPTAEEAWERVPDKFKQFCESVGFTREEFEKGFGRMKNFRVTLTEMQKRLAIKIEHDEKERIDTMKKLKKRSRQFLAEAAERYPVPVKDVLETFADIDDLDDSSKLRDFYVGIPYGTFLCVGGLFNFVVTGSISALRFDVILGGILLALGVSSRRSWRQGKDTDMLLKGQLAIAVILFVRDIRLLFQGVSFGLVKTVISGGVAAFYLYRIAFDKLESQPDRDDEVQS